MPEQVTHPLLYQINTRVCLREWSPYVERPLALHELPDSLLDSIAASGFTWVWLLGLWRTSPASRRVSLNMPAVRRALADTLHDGSDDDIVASPFAISAYEVNPEWGGSRALAQLRERMAARGLKLVADFVPNHTGLDHPWLEEHPEYYVRGTEQDLAREPANWVRVQSRGQSIVLAHGRDPYFPGWPDTLQLDYRRAGLRRAMREQLVRLAAVCDGLRCDMAMLLEPDVFAHTWPVRQGSAGDTDSYDESFWPEAIAAVRAVRHDFMFMAEVYWGREWSLQQAGFDYTYDKELYDRLRAGRGHRVREHLLADPLYQRRSARFLENHDEPRAAHTFPLESHRPAAVIAYLVPGLRLMQEGQLDGKRTQVSMHLGRRPKEPADAALRAFYAQLLACLRRPEVHVGHWMLWVCRAAWRGNDSYRDMLVMSFRAGERALLIAVNYAPSDGQSYTTVDMPELIGRTVTLTDLMSDVRYTRAGDELRTRGLYLAMPAWGYHVFELRCDESPTGEQAGAATG